MNDQKPGETLANYRIRMLEEQFSKMDGKQDDMTETLGDIKHSIGDVQSTVAELVTASKTKSSNASAFRVGATIAVVAAAATGAVTLIVTFVSAIGHLIANSGIQP